MRLFPIFNGDDLKNVPAKMWIPRGFKGCKSHGMFVTGGTTGGRPSRRWGRISDKPDGSDYGRDYHRLSKMLPKHGFPDNGTFLYIGPQGPRRLKRGIAILAAERNSLLFEVDMHVGWMKNPNNTASKAYRDELVRDSIAAIGLDEPESIFCPPVLVQAIGEVFDWSASSVKGILSGGTEMKPETVRFIQDELLGPNIHFLKIFGNALLGLAPSREVATLEQPIEGQRPYSVIYQPFGPHSIMRVTKPGSPTEPVEYGKRGTVVIYTLSNECLITGKVEDRDEAERTRPTIEHPSDGICEVGMAAHLEGKVNVGVY